MDFFYFPRGIASIFRKNKEIERLLLQTESVTDKDFINKFIQETKIEAASQGNIDNTEYFLRKVRAVNILASRGINLKDESIPFNLHELEALCYHNLKAELLHEARIRLNRSLNVYEINFLIKSYEY